MVKGYCMRDRQMVNLDNPSFELNKIGRMVAIGTCPQCKGKVHAILKAEDAPADLKAKAAAFKAKKGGAAARRSRSRKSTSAPKRKSAGAPKRKSRRSRK